MLVDQVARLCEAVRLTRAARPFVIDAWVVLPNHMHCVWTLPKGDMDYSVRWGAIKGRFSSGLPPGRLRQSHVRRREKGIWQRRYWEQHLRDEADWAAHVRYCCINPVKHECAERPEDWPRSSVHRDMKAGTYP